MRPAAAAVALAALAAATLGAAVPPAGIRRVAWLAGCGQAESPHRAVEENWMAPRGRSMVGVSRTVRGPRAALSPWRARPVPARP